MNESTTIAIFAILVTILLAVIGGILRNESRLSTMEEMIKSVNGKLEIHAEAFRADITELKIRVRELEKERISK